MEGGIVDNLSMYPVSALTETILKNSLVIQCLWCIVFYSLCYAIIDWSSKDINVTIDDEVVNDDIQC